MSAGIAKFTRYRLETLADIGSGFNERAIPGNDLARSFRADLRNHIAQVSGALSRRKQFARGNVCLKRV